MDKRSKSMAILCREHKLLFIMVPATGCSAVGGLLCKEFAGVWLPQKDIIRDGLIVVDRKHCTVDQLLQEGVLSPEELGELLVVATVRNPFDRFVTYYQRHAGSKVATNVLWSRGRTSRGTPPVGSDEEEVQRAKENREWHRKRRNPIMRRLGYNNWLKFTLLRWRTRQLLRPTASSSPVLCKEAFPMLGGVHVAMRYEQLDSALNQVLRMCGVQDSVTVPRKNITAGKRAYPQYYDTATRWLAEKTLRHDLALMGYDFSGPTSEDSLIHLNSLPDSFVKESREKLMRA